MIDNNEDQNEEETVPKPPADILPSQAFIDLMSYENDFCLIDETDHVKIHPIARWYGFRSFVVIVPNQSIKNESQIKILLSSLHISIAESVCETPVFVQVLKKDQNVFLGVSESKSTRLSLDIVHLYTVPPTCRYLSGILDMFKGKIGANYMNPVTVGVRLTYCLNKFISKAYLPDKRIAFNEEDFAEDEFDEEMIKSKAIPFGTSIDPVVELNLHCIWSNVADNVVIDSQTYSDFDPLLAPIWSVRAKFDHTPICFASECIAEYLHQSTSLVAISEYYNNLIYEGNSGGNPLDKITESKIPTLSSVLPIGSVVKPSVSSENMMGKDEKRFYGPINDEKLMSMLYYLFPDAQPREPMNMYTLPESEAVC